MQRLLCRGLTSGGGGGGGGLLLEDPVSERGDSLTVDVGVGLGASATDDDLLLDTIGGERTLLLEATRGDVLVARALRTETDVDALDVSRGVPLAGEDVGLGDAILGGLHLGHEGAEAIELNGVTLREELYDTALHLGEDTLDDITTVDGVVLGHVVDETAQRDGLLLLGLGVVLAIRRRVGVVVLAEVDFELGSFYHK